MFSIHENIEFLFFLQGKGRVLCDGDPVEIRAGDIAAINSYAAQHIRENLSSPLTAQSVAASAGVSKYHFPRQFKRLTGVTLSHYINAVRCERARQLLEQGEHKVKEVACLCGFSNMSYFTPIYRPAPL